MTSATMANIFNNIKNGIAQINIQTFAKQGVSSALVNYFTLRVHYVIVFEQALANTKVVLFYFLLCTFDRLGDHAMLDHLSFFVTHTIHEPCYTFASKRPHQFIFQ